MNATAMSGTSGQTMTSISPAMHRNVNDMAAANNTKKRTVKPTHRLIRLSPIARILASMLAPGYVIIRLHGEKSVKSSVLTENVSANPLKRFFVADNIPAQPLPYHQLNRSSINIVTSIVAFDCRGVELG